MISPPSISAMFVRTPPAADNRAPSGAADDCRPSRNYGDSLLISWPYATPRQGSNRSRRCSQPSPPRHPAWQSRRDDGVVTVAPVLDRVDGFAAFLDEPFDEDAAFAPPRRSATTGRPVGTAAWIRRLEQQFAARWRRASPVQSRGSVLPLLLRYRMIYSVNCRRNSVIADLRVSLLSE